MSLQAPVAEGDVLTGASAADAASEPDTPLHSTDMRDRSEKPTQSALAKPDRALSSSRARARCATPAPVLPNMESVLILLFVFAARKSHRKLSETR